MFFAITTLIGLGCLTPAQDEAFANPELLVTTDWLLENLEADGVRVVDVRDAVAYGAGHIPGAVNVPRSATFDPKSRGNIAPGEAIAKLFGDLGVNEASHVVLYDEGKSTAAARVFWTLEVYGHPNVSVLDGGFAKWTAEELGELPDVPDFEPVVFAVKSPSAQLSKREHLLEDVDLEEAAFVDSRSNGEVGGGKIPGAVHLEWTLNYTDDEVAVLKSPSALAKLYADQGITPDKRVHCY